MRSGDEWPLHAPSPKFLPDRGGLLGCYISGVRTREEGPLSKRDAQRLAALIKKTAAKTPKNKGDRAAQYDDTLRQRPPEHDAETNRLFKEMKRREF